MKDDHDITPTYLLLPLGKWGSKWGYFHWAMGCLIIEKAPSDSPIWQLKKRELLLPLSFLITKPILISLYIFEGSVFTFQFLNDEIHNYVFFFDIHE